MYNIIIIKKHHGHLSNERLNSDGHHKQNDDLLHNYTVAKATMDCNFDDDCTCITENGKILEASEPECYKMKLISCTYHFVGKYA